EAGLEHQAVMPEVPTVEESPPLSTMLGSLSDDAAERWRKEWAALDVRYVGDNRDDGDPSKVSVPAVQRMWFRADGDLPDDPELNACVLTYISDLSLLGSALVPHGIVAGSPRV